MCLYVYLKKINSSLEWSQVSDATSTRYEVPMQLDLPETPGSDPEYKIEFDSERFGFQVTRKSTGNVM